MEYRENGSAAVDFYQQRLSTALPLEQPHHLPDAPKKTAPVRRPKARLHVSLLLVLSGAAAVFLLFLVIFNYMALYEAQSRVGDLKAEQKMLLDEQERLQSAYENAIDLRQVETRARAIGMREPLPAQVVYVEIASGDSTEVHSAPKEKNLLTRFVDAIQDSLSDVVEYFS